MILAIDGAKGRLGAAILDADNLEQVHIRTYTPEDAPVSCARDLLSWIEDLDAPIHIVAAEEHSFTANARSVEASMRYDQGGIAWKLGWVSGVVAGVVAFDRRAELRRVKVSTWRSTMLAQLKADGQERVGQPSRRALERRLRDDVRFERGDGTAVVVRYVNCGHPWVAADLNQLTKGHPDLCPTCNPPARKAPDPGDDLKRQAVEGALRRWPVPFEAFVAAARGRARVHADGPPHHLEGVSDAAEAAWIGWHVARNP